MTCCRSKMVFKKEKSIDSLTMDKLKIENKTIVMNEVAGSIEHIANNTTRHLSGFSKDSTEDNGLIPCEFREPFGTKNIGSQQFTIYYCTKFHLKVHKSHCDKCPLSQRK